MAEAVAAQAEASPLAGPGPQNGARSAIGAIVRDLEVDVRMVGMLVVLAGIWIGFNFASDGTFLTARNLWNLSVQTASVGVMATGMVLIIVSRNIDLSVGSMLGFIGVVVGHTQVEILPDILGFEHPLTWVIAVLLALTLGALIGGLQGFIIAYVGVPAFIVTLGGLLVWRGTAWWVASGVTIAPMDSTYQLLGGGAEGSAGATWSWIVGFAACAGIFVMLIKNRRDRLQYGFPVRPIWALATVLGLSWFAVLGAVKVANSYYWPEGLARQHAEENNIPWPEGGLKISLGIAYPVLILIGVALVMTFIATRLRFGRYVYAIGGNPEAAELGGINTRWTVMKTFMLMGVLVGISAVISTARLNAATNGMGELAELSVIAAAVIGGTSFTGGIGSIPGAVLGALVMQSLQSGMVLVGIDAPLQNIVIGIVLVIAVAIDTTYQRYQRRLT